MKMSAEAKFQSVLWLVFVAVCAWWAWRIATSEARAEEARAEGRAAFDREAETFVEVK